MKDDKAKKLIIEQLKKMPIIQVACEKTHIARASFYRWKKDNKKFAKEVEEAIAEGEAMITDLSEVQLINLVRDKEFHAIQLWLRSHHPKYTTKIEVSGKINSDEPLTKAQKETIRQALKLSSLRDHENKKKPKPNNR